MIRQGSNYKPEGEGGLRGWQLGVLAAGTFTLGVDGFVLAGLLPAIADDLSVSVSTAGQLTTIFSITYAVGSPVLAALTGRWDRRLLLGGGLALFLLGMAGQALAPSYAVMAAGRAAAALGAAAFQSNAYVMAGMLADGRRRGRALAAVTAGTSLSTVLGVPFGVLAGQWFGWRAVLWVITALAALTAFCVPLLPRAHVPPTNMRARLGVLTRPAVLLVLLATVAVVAPPILLISYLPVVLGMADTDGRLVVILLAFGLGSLTGNRLVGRLVDGRGALGVLLVAVAGLAASFAVLVPAREEYGAALAVLLAVGAFQGLSITPQQHRLFVVAPDVATVALGLNGSAIYLGSALGAALGGVTLDAAGAATIPATAAVLAAAGLALIATTAPERRPRTAATPVATAPTGPAPAEPVSAEPASAGPAPGQPRPLMDSGPSTAAGAAAARAARQHESGR
ncbi:arabinose efflux permease family protein [Frankia torreyi]|uniref:Arabinose efflux permease family protein n=2 Tax=Frankiaceae TaxID=74712 RepID=A0A0D8B7V5_9ACTN|nr:MULTISPECIES: MFS transporter [Frankia]KJE20195.1 arabinose efflux permease family protein [Frankia torreyi]KQM02455.1 arabinose efflux permease family protein [Frankia sp. CpI1-P]